MTGIVVSVATTLAGAAALVAWLRRRFVVIDVDGRSMQPTLHEGDRVLVRRRPLQHIRTGDIVIVENPGGRNLAEQDWVIKRAVAVPGDPVPASMAAAVTSAAGSPVPDGRLLVLGDNPSHSADSRQHGYLSGDSVLGVVVRRMGRGTRTAAQR